MALVQPHGAFKLKLGFFNTVTGSDMIKLTKNIMQHNESFLIIMKFICLSSVIFLIPQQSSAQDISARAMSKAEEHFNLDALEELLYSNSDDIDDRFDCHDTSLFGQTRDYMQYVCTSNSAQTKLIEFSSDIKDKSSVMLCLSSIPSDGRYFKDSAFDTIAASTSQGEAVGTQYFMGHHDGWTRDYVNIYAELNIDGWGDAACWSLLRR